MGFHVHGPHDHEVEHNTHAGVPMAARVADARSDESMHRHHRWAQSMALIPIAIALAAITLLRRQKWLQWGPTAPA